MFKFHAKIPKVGEIRKPGTMFLAPLFYTYNVLESAQIGYFYVDFTILLIKAAYILSEILSVTLAAMLHCPRIYMAMDRIMIETLLQAILQQVEQPKKDLEHNLRALLNEAVSKMDLVSKEELERQRTALNNANQRLNDLLKQVEELEEKSRLKISTTTVHKRHENNKNNALYWNNNMSFAKIYTRGLLGLHAPLIEVEVHVSSGMPSSPLWGFLKPQSEKVRIGFALPF